MDVKKYAVENANGWIIKNLKKWGNSVFPAKMIRNDEDKEACERLLSEIMQTTVEIYKTEGGYICECVK